MTCIEAREALLNGELTAELEKHREGCSSCRAERALVAAAEARLFSEIDAFIDDDEAFERAWTSIRASTPARKRFFTMPNMLLAATAAAVIGFAASSVPTATPEAAQEQKAPELDPELALNTSATPWNALTEKEWAERAHQLYEQLEVVKSHQLTTEDAFRVAYETGRTAENSNNAVTPFFGTVENGLRVNLGYWEAAKIANANPKVLEILDPDAQKTIRFLMKKLPEAGSESKP